MIVVFGSINVDLFFDTAELPLPGETVSGIASAPQPGGKGANQALAAARDGGQVIMTGAVGLDQWAEIGLRQLQEAGIDLSKIRQVPATTGLAVIVKEKSGQNQIVVSPGANHQATASDVGIDLLAPSTILLLQMECDVSETSRLIHRAADAGVQVILNLAPASDISVDTLRRLHYLILNETEASWLAERIGTEPTALAIHLTLGITVIRTLGANGAEMAHNAVVVHKPAPKVIAADTTAAGDCFVGVFAAGIDRAMTPQDAMERAIQAASLCCTRHGSQISLPDKSEIDGLTTP